MRGKVAKRLRKAALSIKLVPGPKYITQESGTIKLNPYTSWKYHYKVFKRVHKQSYRQ